VTAYLPREKGDQGPQGVTMNKRGGEPNAAIEATDKKKAGKACPARKTTKKKQAAGNQPRRPGGVEDALGAPRKRTGGCGAEGRQG